MFRPYGAGFVEVIGCYKHFVPTGRGAGPNVDIVTNLAREQEVDWSVSQIMQDLRFPRARVVGLQPGGFARK